MSQATIPHPHSTVAGRHYGRAVLAAMVLVVAIVLAVLVGVWTHNGSTKAPPAPPAVTHAASPAPPAAAQVAPPAPPAVTHVASPAPPAAARVAPPAPPAVAHLSPPAWNTPECPRIGRC